MTPLTLAERMAVSRGRSTSSSSSTGWSAPRDAGRRALQDRGAMTASQTERPSSSRRPTTRASSRELHELARPARPRARLRRRARPARTRGDRRQLCRQRADQGARGRRSAAGCPRSPTIPASASTASTARPESIRRGGRQRRLRRRDGAHPARADARGAPQSRGARYFISALALCWPDGHVETFEGRVDGELVFPAARASGFGYDPIFLPDGHDSHLRRDDFGRKTRHSPRRLARAVASRARVSATRKGVPVSDTTAGRPASAGAGRSSSRSSSGRSALFFLSYWKFGIFAATWRDDGDACW